MRAVRAGSAPGRRSGTAALPARAERIGDEPLRRQLRPAQIAARQPGRRRCAARPGTPTGTGRRLAVEHVDAACWRSAGRSAPRPRRPPGSQAQDVTSTAASVGP